MLGPCRATIALRYNLPAFCDYVIIPVMDWHKALGLYAALVRLLVNSRKLIRCCATPTAPVQVPTIC